MKNTSQGYPRNYTANTTGDILQVAEKIYFMAKVSTTPFSLGIYRMTMPKFTSQILLLYSKVLHILENLLLKNFTGLKVVSWTGSQQQNTVFLFSGKTIMKNHCGGSLAAGGAKPPLSDHTQVSASRSLTGGSMSLLLLCGLLLL